MAQCPDIIGVPSDEDRRRDLGGVFDRLGRDQIADVVPVNAFFRRDRDEYQLGHRVHRSLRGNHGLVEFGAKDGQLNILDLHSQLTSLQIRLPIG